MPSASNRASPASRRPERPGHCPDTLVVRVSGWALKSWPRPHDRALVLVTAIADAGLTPGYAQPAPLRPSLTASWREPPSPPLRGEPDGTVCWETISVWARGTAALNEGSPRARRLAARRCLVKAIGIDRYLEGHGHQPGWSPRHLLGRWSVEAGQLGGSSPVRAVTVMRQRRVCQQVGYLPVLAAARRGSRPGGAAWATCSGPGGLPEHGGSAQ